MNKAILLSVRPKHAVHILNGEKTLELRKSVPTDFENIIKKHGGIWVNIYVTKGKPYLYRINNWRDDESLYSEFNLSNSNGEEKATILNGKVVARFWFDKYVEINYEKDYGAWVSNKTGMNAPELLEKAKVSVADFHNYFANKGGYVWHIKQLEIFDEPMELENFYTRNDMLDGLYFERKAYQFEYVKKAPRTWQYVWTDGKVEN